jgi:hypothetical protein
VKQLPISSNKQFVLKIIPIVLLGYFLALSGSWIVQAQETQSPDTSVSAGSAGIPATGETEDVSQALVITAIPPRTDLIKIKPGETVQLAIQIRNVSNRTQQVSSHAQDFVIDKDGKTPLPVSAEEAAPLRWSLAKWITLSPAQRTVGPNELVQYDMVIQAPADALPGGHYAMVLHYPTPASARTGGGTDTAQLSASEVSPRVGTLVYVEVAGDVKEEAFIRNFKAPTWVEYGPVEMSYEIENLSDIHITPQSSIKIKNIFGLPSETIAVEPLNIFPYSTRSFTATFDQVWGLGPYTAELTVPYGNTGKMVQASILFWIIPYRLILAALVILFSILAIIIVIRKHLAHKNDVKSQQIEILEERIKELEKRID